MIMMNYRKEGSKLSMEKNGINALILTVLRAPQNYVLKGFPFCSLIN